MADADARAFEQAALPHLESVYRVARRLSGNDADAEDLVQDTYLKAQKAFARFELRSFGIRPWLLRILHNTFINRRVREKHAPRSADTEMLELAQSDASSLALADAPPGLDYEQMDAEVKAAIERLPEEFRSVLLLWATMEHSYQEIAEILEVPIGTVMSRLHRARQQLTRALHEYAREYRVGVTRGEP